MAGVDWSERGTYIRTRSERRSGDIDVQPEWADEALEDPDRIVFDPDYASRSGYGVRTIGFSAGAERLLVVITLVDRDSVWGVNAWAANNRDSKTYGR